MQLDVTDLARFYASRLGGVVRRLVLRRVRARWPRVTGLTVIGTGYAVPYLSVFAGEAARLGAMMPARQGVLAWPGAGPYRSVLVGEDALPLEDACVDRLLVVHHLEMCEAVRPTLRELWRVLRPEGRMLMVVPNRRGLWARRDTTPFGHGQPYSRGQLEGLLEAALFRPLDWQAALFMPPLGWPVMRRSAMAFERLGSGLWPAFSGVLVVEASKEVVAPIAAREARMAEAPIAAAPAAPATLASRCDGAPYAGVNPPVPRAGPDGAREGTRPARPRDSARKAAGGSRAAGRRH